MPLLAQLKKILRPDAGTDTSAEWAALDESDRQLIREIRSRRLTYLSERRLASLARTSRALRERQVDGLFVEAGCALGGSAALIALVKEPERPFQVYDVFGMIPPPTQADTPDVHQRYQAIVQGQSKGIEGDTYYGYEENLYSKVITNLQSFGIDLEKQHVALIKGLVQETLWIDEPVALAHVDVDWYEPVMTCLTRIYPKLAAGGSIILDDYHAWGGCRKATDEFLRRWVGTFALDDSAGSMKVTRTRA